MEFGAFREFFDALAVHPLYLNDEQLATLLHLAHHFLFFRFSYFNRTVVFNASLDMFFYVTN